jgi:hypothetical protein
MMKLEARNSREQTLTHDVAGQAHDYLIIGAPGNVLADGLEIEFRHVYAAQKPASELTLINQLLAALERQRLSGRLLRGGGRRRD